MQTSTSGQSPSYSPINSPSDAPAYVQSQSQSQSPIRDTKNSHAQVSVVPASSLVSSLAASPQTAGLVALTDRHVRQVLPAACATDQGSSRTSQPSAASALQSVEQSAAIMLDAKAADSLVRADFVSQIKSLQFRMINDDALSLNQFVARYEQDLAFLHTAVIQPETSKSAVYLLAIYLGRIINMPLPNQKTADQASAIIRSYFALIESHNTQLIEPALMYVTHFVRTQSWSSSAAQEISAFILQELRGMTKTLVAQLSVPELYTPVVELLIDMAHTSLEHARDVMAAIAAAPAAALALTAALLRTEDFVYPQPTGAAPIFLLRTLINQLDNFSEVLQVIPSTSGKVAFVRGYSLSSSSVFRQTTQRFSEILDVIKATPALDTPTLIALLLAVVGSHSAPQAQQYLVAMNAKSALDGKAGVGGTAAVDSRVRELLPAAISLASGNSAFLLASKNLSVEIKLNFLENFYSQTVFVVSHSRDLQYRQLHASNMPEVFKNTARQMLLDASSSAPGVELSRLIAMVINGRDIASIFVAARGFLEDQIKQSLPNFFTAPIAVDTKKDGLLAYTAWREEYFVLYHSFLENPHAEISGDFIHSEIARTLALPVDMQDVLKTMLNTYLRTITFKVSSAVIA